MKTDRWPNLLTDIRVAAVLLTRLPLPRLDDSAFSNGARATWAYPLTGLVLGALAASFGYVATALGLPAFVAAGIMLAVLMISTGAMHEDGLADVADGFWGGYTRERRLEIMKDSQIGTFGTLALIVVTGLRWAGYALVLQHSFAACIAAAVLSRAAMPAMMCALPHARSDGLSHSVGRPPVASAAIAAVLAVGLCLVPLGWSLIASTVAILAVGTATGWLARAKIGGQTGDVLGATQQISEVAVLLAIAATI